MGINQIHEGIIYGYPHYVGQVQSADPKRLARRHKKHLRTHPDWATPIILEHITGIDRADLLFNLAWAETVWMFKKRTYRLAFPFNGGFNKAIPCAADHTDTARIGGRIGAFNVHKEKNTEGKSLHAIKMGSNSKGIVGARGHASFAKYGCPQLNTPESNLKSGLSRRGQKRTEETCSKISEKAKLRVGILNGFYGKTHSVETCEQISKTKQGQGHPHSPETKVKLRVAALRRWARVREARHGD